MSDQPAKKDFAKVHLALARWRLAHPNEPAPDDEVTKLFDDDEVGAATERHPAGGSA
jgi:hypothetical protein